MSGRYDLTVLVCEPPDYRTAYHSAVARNVDALVVQRIVLTNCHLSLEIDPVWTPRTESRLLVQAIVLQLLLQNAVFI
jgi:hypothetical protein